MKYEPTWESLSQYQAPDWFTDAKFGIFIHYGVYSVPAQGCWYGNGMYRPDHPWYEHHLRHWGGAYDFGYKDFIPLFKAERFDPEAWVDLFARAGARYVVPVTDFHDAFAMYDSDLTPWTAVKMGPKRDILGDLKRACTARDLRFGVSSHLAMNWRFFPHDPAFDTAAPQYAALYGEPHGAAPPKGHLDRWLARSKELIDKVQPDKLWLDTGICRPEFEPGRRELAAYYYNRALEWGKEVVLTYKRVAFEEGTAVLDLERGRLGDIRPMIWQTDTSIGKHDWSYRDDEEYKSIASLIAEFVDIVSKNGVLLLNIGPKADGTIPPKAQETLLAFGRWLEVNGEAIYGTRPWAIYGEGPTRMVAGDKKEHEDGDKRYTPQDIRFTTKGDLLYALFLDWPGPGPATIQSLKGNALLGRSIRAVELLGYDVPLKWTHDHHGLHLHMPEERPCDYACAVKITTE